MKNYVIQWPDGEFVAPVPLISTPFARFAMRFEIWETLFWMWPACGARALRIEEPNEGPAKFGEMVA